jgi:DNA-binding NtrC family response regulator
MAAGLIVDDEKEIRVFLRQLVEREGHDVLEACDGFEALAVLDREEVGLAVVDLVMPHMNGVELMQRMQKEFPDTKIVTVSAYGTSWICPGELTIESSLTKPFHVKDLRAVLRRVLGKPPNPRRDRE